MEECCSKDQCKPAQECSVETKHEGIGEWLLSVADEAWTEVLKEKIKEHILATQGDRMAELAKIVSEGNNARWKNKMEKKHGCMDFKEKLGRFFGSKK